MKKLLRYIMDGLFWPYPGYNPPPEHVVPPKNVPPPPPRKKPIEISITVREE